MKEMSGESQNQGSIHYVGVLICKRFRMTSNSQQKSEMSYCTAEPKTPGVPWCFEFFVPNIKHKGTPRILSKLLKPRTSLVFRGVLKPTKFFMS